MKFYQILLILTAVGKGCLSAWDVASPQDISKQCAQIYFQPSFQGPSLQLKDEEQVSDLSDLHYYFTRTNNNAQQQSESGDDVDQTLEGTGSVPPISFQVQSDCQLKLSPHTYLKYDVSEFSGDVESMTPDWLVPKSAACECPKSCKCEDNKLRRSECARAYLKDDCTNCKAVFTSMKASSGDGRKRFPEKWAAEVKSIILRDSCKLSLDFFSNDGPKTEIFDYSSSRVVKDIQSLGNVTRYECSCHNEFATVSQHDTKERNENYPPLVNIPKTKGAINALLANQGLRNHPGLLASLQSLRNKRNSKNAYILLLGLTGSGKSSTANLLFDHPNITKVGDFVSTTSDILQFSTPVQVDELGMNNTVLHVIDTPGIGDTRGIAEDARFLASLDDYLRKNEDLRQNLPNVVLIFSKFSDNRYRGEGSPFVKMLRTIDLFKDRIIDKKSTNVIFVLTHYMSETKEITRDPRERIESIRKVIQEFSTLPRPIHIVLAENKPEETHLPSINGFYRLPSGGFYPKNLFNQMQRNLIDNGDPVGEAIIRSAFSNSDNFQISATRHRLLHPSNAKVTKYLGVLGSFNVPVSNTEVSRQLNTAYESLDADLKHRYSQVLNTLQRTLYLRNIKQITDFPQTTEDLLRLLKEIQVNPVTLHLLHEAFNITLPSFSESYVVGSGYSLVKDETLPASIFQIGQGKPSDLILLMPDTFEITLQNQLQNVFQVSNNPNDFISARMRSLGLSDDALPRSTYSASPSKFPGYNLIHLGDEEDDDSSWNSLSAVVNYHTFQIRLSENPQFSPDFVEYVGKLQPLNLTDWENVESWSTFFDRYGTHVVTHAFGGGSIKIKVEVVEDDGDEVVGTRWNNTEKFAVLGEAIGNIMQQLANDLIGKQASYLPPPGIKYEFSQKGGSHRHFWSNFTDLDDIKNVDRWRDSLQAKPVILTSRLQLVPISEIVKEYSGNRELGYMIEEAAANLLNASLVYIPMQRISNDDNPESREMTFVGQMMGGSGDVQSMHEFGNMFKALTDATRDMQAQLVQMLAETSKKQQMEDQRYNEELLIRKQEQAEQDRIAREEARWNKEMELKREEMEIQRRAQNEAVRLQHEQAKFQMEMQQQMMLQEMRAKQEQTMFAFINAENDRQAQIVMNQKGWLDKTFDFLGNTWKSVQQSMSAAAPALMAAMGR